MGSASSCLNSAVAPLNPSSPDEDGDQSLLDKLASQPALLSKPVPGLSMLLGGVAQTWIHVACERKQIHVVKRMCQFLSTSSLPTVREALAPYCRRMGLPLPESAAEGLRLAVGMCNGRGQTPLMHACYAGSPELVKLLLDKGADPWAADRCGCRTALHYAAIAGCVGCVTALTQSSAAQQLSSYGVRYVDNRSLSGLTALHYAVYYERHEVLRELLRHAPDINAATSCSSYDIWLDCDAASTPLHFAAARGNAVAVQELLRYYASRRLTGEVADPRLACNSSGRQPWHLAASQYPALRYLTVVLQPGQPLTRIVGGDDGSQTTSMGAPSLAAIAATALRQRLLASVAVAEAEAAAIAATAIAPAAASACAAGSEKRLGLFGRAVGGSAGATSGANNGGGRASNSSGLAGILRRRALAGPAAVSAAPVTVTSGAASPPLSPGSPPPSSSRVAPGSPGPVAVASAATATATARRPGDGAQAAGVDAAGAPIAATGAQGTASSRCLLSSILGGGGRTPPACAAAAGAAAAMPGSAPPSPGSAALDVQPSCHSVQELGSRRHPFGVGLDTDQDLDPDLRTVNAAAVAAAAGSAEVLAALGQRALCSSPDLAALQAASGSASPVAGGAEGCRARVSLAARWRRSSGLRAGPAEPTGCIGPIGAPTLHRCTTSPPCSSRGGSDRLDGGNFRQLSCQPAAAAAPLPGFGSCTPLRVPPQRVINTDDGYFLEDEPPAVVTPPRAEAAAGELGEGDKDGGAAQGAARTGGKDKAGRVSPIDGSRPDCTPVLVVSRGSLGRRAGANGDPEEGEEPDLTCSVCFARRKTVAPSGCGHGLCASCARELCHGVTARPLLCPFCRQRVTGFVRFTGTEPPAAAEAVVPALERGSPSAAPALLAARPTAPAMPAVPGPGPWVLTAAQVQG